MYDRSMEKINCNCCDWRGTYDTVLQAENPLSPGDIFLCCPNCKSINDFYRACSVENCFQRVDVGMPTKEGYKFFCHKHAPKNI